MNFLAEHLKNAVFAPMSKSKSESDKNDFERVACAGQRHSKLNQQTDNGKSVQDLFGKLIIRTNDG